MHKLLLSAVAILPLIATAPVFAQGVQTPSAPNANPPAGTASTAGRGATMRPSSARHRRAARHRATNPTAPAVQGVQNP